MNIQLLTNVYFIIISILKFSFLVLLVYMTLKTKSKGLTLIVVTYILVTLFEYFLSLRLYRFLFGSIPFKLRHSIFTTNEILKNILPAIGVYLCYTEWKQGKLSPNNLK